MSIAPSQSQKFIENIIPFDTTPVLSFRGNKMLTLFVVYFWVSKTVHPYSI